MTQVVTSKSQLTDLSDRDLKFVAREFDRLQQALVAKLVESSPNIEKAFTEQNLKEENLERTRGKKHRTSNS